MLGTNVEKQIAGCGDGVAPLRADLSERVQFRWSRLTEEPVPRIRSDTHNARKPVFRRSKSHGAHKRGQIGAQGSHLRPWLGAWVDGCDQKERGARERRVHRLWNGAAYHVWF